MLQSLEVNVPLKLIQFSRDLFCTLDRQGVFLQVSAAAFPLLGFAPDELVGLSFLDVVIPADKEKAKFQISDLLKTNNCQPDFLLTNCTAQGETIDLLWSLHWEEAHQLLHCLARSCSQETTTPIINREQMLSALVAQGSDMQCLLSEEGDFLFSSGSTFRLLGYRNQALVGRNGFSFLHPNDLPAAREALRHILSTGQVFLKQFRFLHANGQWVWLEAVVTNHLQYPGIQALVLTARDITRRMEDRLKLKESEQRFKVLFMNNPDAVFYQDPAGLLLDMNAAAEALLGVDKAQMLQQPLVDFLPLKAQALAQDTQQQALAGETIRFEQRLDLPGAQDSIFEVSKYPVYLQDKIMGVFSALRDVSDITQYYHTIHQQAKKLDFVFDSISDAFLLIDQEEKINIVNRKFEETLGLKREVLLGKNVWEIFPEEVGSLLYHKLYRALHTGKATEFETYFLRLKIWVKVKVFPSEEGISLYFTDITGKKIAKKELEKLSLVASKIQNSVLITDAAGVIEWVNDAFTVLTGYALPEVVGKMPKEFLFGPDSDPAHFERMINEVLTGKSFTEINLNYTKTGEKYWASTDVTPIRDKEGTIIQYIGIQKNITESKEAEARQLEMTKVLFEQNRDLHQFTYIISHNLRAPVANTLGLAELLTKVDVQSPMFQTALYNLKETAFKMDTVLRDLNLILSVRDKLSVEEFVAVDVATVIEQAAYDFQELLADCKAEVEIDIEKGLIVKGIRAYLHSIFYNLFSNSLKYRAPDRVLEIKVKCYDSEKRGPAITFSDNGTGFDMTKAGDDVFKLYKRFHKNKNGRGMGLFLVKTHIEAMGGSIEVTSQLNAGTRFLIHFGLPHS